MKIHLLIIVMLCFGIRFGAAQLKIGENSHQIDEASILELESTDRALVLTRVTSAEMDAIVPLNGALVYNTDAKCIFVFEGAIWKSLCNSEISVTSAPTMPTANQVGDIWIDTAENLVSVWNGTDFVLINRNPKSGDGAPSTMTVQDPFAGDIYIDRTNGDLYTYNGTDWVTQSNTVQADNGLSLGVPNTVELGGGLTKPTAIGTDATNTLAITGLEVTADDDDMIVVVDATTETLKKTPASALVQKEETIIIANNGENQFTTPLTITDTKKIDVYRNGVKIGFTAIGSNMIELETDVICFQNDEIRIVQFF